MVFSFRWGYFCWTVSRRNNFDIIFTPLSFRSSSIQVWILLLIRIFFPPPSRRLLWTQSLKVHFMSKIIFLSFWSWVVRSLLIDFINMIVLRLWQSKIFIFHCWEPHLLPNFVSKILISSKFINIVSLFWAESCKIFWFQGLTCHYCLWCCQAFIF